MKLSAFIFIAALVGASTVQAEVINRRSQCDRWEYIPASEALGNPETALLFCTENNRTWLSLRIECLADEKRMSIIYRPGFNYDLPIIAQAQLDPNQPIDETLAAEEAFAEIPLENATSVPQVELPIGPREMVFMDFRSFGYTSVAYFGENTDWQFFEPEPLSPVFSRLITGSYADISLLATGTTERLPLRGSGKALRPLVKACRLAKKKS